MHKSMSVKIIVGIAVSLLVTGCVTMLPTGNDDGTGNPASKTAYPPVWVSVKEGCRIRQIIDKFDTMEWTGSCQNGYAEGLGKLQFRKNSEPYLEYEGLMKHGELSGRFRITQYNPGNIMDADSMSYGPGGIANSNNKAWVGTIGDKSIPPFTLADAQNRPQRSSASQPNACINARVPNPQPLANESTLFYGDCKNGNGITGIVIWQIKSVPNSLSCLKNGKYEPGNRIDAFDACEPFWPLINNFCRKGDYRGQCKNGIPEGVGFKSSHEGSSFDYSLSIKNGQFSNGELNGYAYSASISGCGMAGCSGNLKAETGWFNDGKKIVDCSTYPECLTKISGKDYVTRKSSLTLDDKTNLEKLRKQSTFESVLEAFDVSGDRIDLRRAEQLAKSQQQKAQLEYIFLRTAGFNKVINLTAVAKQGKKAVDVSDSKRLFGLINSVDSEIPLAIDWKLSSNKAPLQLRYGKYLVQIKVGVNVKRKVHTCAFGTCKTEERIDELLEEIRCDIIWK